MGEQTRDSIAFMLGLSPFDPSVNKPVILPGGGAATEYTASSQDDAGRWFVHPQIWWDQDGNPTWMQGDRGRTVALLREMMGNPAMPRFKSEQEANDYAGQRSHVGGGTSGKIGGY